MSAVDVLAVMDRQSAIAESAAKQGRDTTGGDIACILDELKQARAAVAELIEATQAAIDRSLKLNPKAIPGRAGKDGIDSLLPEARVVFNRVEAAIARCGGTP